MNRRQLLMGSAALTLFTYDNSNAFFRHGQFNIPFNGHKTQINLFWGNPDYPFTNVLKQASLWGYNGGTYNGQLYDPIDMDADGYPSTNLTAGGAGGVRAYFYHPTQPERLGTYTITGQGTGTIQINSQPNGKVELASVGVSGNWSKTITMDTGVEGYSATVVNPGSGGTDGSVTLTLVGGTFTSASTISGTILGGVLTAVGQAFNNSSNYTAWPSNPVAVTGGGLVGATINVKWSGQSILYVSSSSAAPNNIRNLSICLSSDNPTQVFQSHWLGYMQQVGVIRHMDTMYTVESNAFKWADRTPVSYMSYSGAQNPGWFPQQCFAGTADPTVGGGANNLAYLITGASNFPSNYSPVHGDRVFCQFSAVTGFSNKTIQSATASGTNTILQFASDPSQFSAGMQIYLNANNAGSTKAAALSWRLTTISSVDHGAFTITIPVDLTAVSGSYTASYSAACAVPTLSINGGPAIPLAGNSNQIISSPIGTITTGNKSAWSTLVYEGNTGQWLIWDDVGGVGMTGINGGWPPEIVIALSNACGAHPWFCIPWMASNSSGLNGAISDYTTGLATLCKNTLSTHLVPRFEPSNECWGSQPAAQVTYAIQWNRLFQTYGAYQATSVYGANDCYGQWVSQVGQAVSAVYGGDMTKYQLINAQWNGVGPQDFRLTSPTYVHNTSSANAAYKWSTHLAAAPYWRSGYLGGTQESTWADAWAAAAPGAAQQAYIDLYFAGCNPAAISSSTSNTVAGGAKTFTVATGLSISAGNPVTAVDNTTVGNLLRGSVTSYNSGTGSLVTNMNSAIFGSGTSANWSIYISPSSSGADILPAMEGMQGVFYAYANASSYGLNNAGNKQKYTQYEGGYESPPSGSTNVVNFRKASKWSTLNSTYSLIDFNNFAALGALAEFPSTYAFAGVSTWTMFDPDTYVTPPYSTYPPRWQAILDLG